jgi:hypothetical protein
MTKRTWRRTPGRCCTRRNSSGSRTNTAVHVLIILRRSYRTHDIPVTDTTLRIGANGFGLGHFACTIRCFLIVVRLVERESTNGSSTAKSIGARRNRGTPISLSGSLPRTTCDSSVPACTMSTAVDYDTFPIGFEKNSSHRPRFDRLHDEVTPHVLYVVIILLFSSYGCCTALG